MQDNYLAYRTQVGKQTIAITWLKNLIWYNLPPSWVVLISDCKNQRLHQEIH